MSSDVRDVNVPGNVTDAADVSERFNVCNPVAPTKLTASEGLFCPCISTVTSDGQLSTIIEVRGDIELFVDV